MSLEKAKFFEKEVEFLEHIVAKNVIEIDLHKVEAICDFPLRKTVRQLRSFLGMTIGIKGNLSRITQK